MTFPRPSWYNDPNIVMVLRGLPDNPSKVETGLFHRVTVIDGRGSVVFQSGFLHSNVRISQPVDIVPGRRRGSYVVYSVLFNRFGEPGKREDHRMSLHKRVDTDSKPMSARRLISSRRLQGPRKNPKARHAFPSSVPGGRPNVSVSEVWSVRNWNSFQGEFTTTFKNIQTYLRTSSGTRTPNFAALQARGSLLPVNPYAMSEWRLMMGHLIKVETGIASTDESRSDRPMTDHYNMPGGPSHLTTALDKAIKSVIGKSDSSLGGNLGQDFATLGQTVGMIAGTATRVAGAIHDLKHGNIPGAVNKLWSGANPKFRPRGGPKPSRDLASNWLELQYGWKPLLGDVRDSMEALAKFNLGNTYVRRVSGVGRVTNETTTLSNSFEGVALGTPVNTTVVTESFAKIGLRYSVDSHLTSFLAQTGFTNPINLAWELLPYSFVVDWFLPIGAYLQTLSAWDGLRFVDGFQIQLTRQRASVTVSYSGHPPGSSPASYNITERGQMVREWVIFNRSKLTSFPSGRFPEFKSPFSVSHALNAVALLRQAF